jgi:LmbE family N-acetylglucosaminyl deacetylase
LENPRFRTVTRTSSLASGRIVVVSPHLDDAVMSLGATIAGAVAAGATVEILTVFGYRPGSPAPAGPWDSRSGYRTEGEAALHRRREDAEACRILGAEQRVMSFGAEPYERGAEPGQIRAAVVAAVAGADCVLMPGFPLVHPDHDELTQLLLGAGLPCRVGLYAEQPYLFYERKTLRPEMRAATLDESLTGRLHWLRLGMGRSERRLKMRAIRCYRSQLRPLGLSRIGLYWLLWHEARRGGEAVAWLP